MTEQNTHYFEPPNAASDDPPTNAERDAAALYDAYKGWCGNKGIKGTQET